MNALAEVFEPQIFIGRERRNEFGHHAPEFGVGVVGILKLLQFGHHRVPAALGDADRKHDEEGVKARFLNDDTVLRKILRDDGRRDPGFGKFTGKRQPRRHHRPLDGVKHVKARCHIPEAVPGIIGVKHPVGLRAASGLRQFLRPPDRKPPVGVARTDFAHGSPEIHGFLNGFFHERRTGPSFHHGRSDVAACDDRVLRRSGRVHHEGFIKSGAVKLLGFRVLDTDLACLRNTRKQLMR